VSAPTPVEAAASLGPLSDDQCRRIAALLSLAPKPEAVTT
jgi:hypothetical protein